MRSVYLLLPALLLLLALPVSRGRYNDDFDDGEDLADFADDNDFAEFEDVSEDTAAEPETAPPPRAAPPAQPAEDDEDEATVELEEDGHEDGFEDSDTQVRGSSGLVACI